MSSEALIPSGSQPDIPGKYKSFSAEEKAEALCLLESKGGIGKIRETARNLGISEGTLRYWIESETSEMREIRAGRKGELADQFEHISRVYLDRALEPDAIAKTSGYYAVIAASDAMKSSQLLRGQPTEIVERVDSTKVLLLLADALAPAIDVTPCASGEDQAQAPNTEVSQNQADTDP